MKKSISFTGISSGDCECFCWDVTKEQYIELLGEKRAERYESEFEEFASFKWQVYPTDIIKLLTNIDRTPKRFTLSIIDD